MTTDDATSTRRGLLTIAAGASAAASPIGSAPARTAGADAELVALCEGALTLEAEIDRLNGVVLAAEKAGNDPLADACFDRQVALKPDLDRALAEIARRPARTPAGGRAKARVALTQLRYDRDGAPISGDALVHSLCRDVLGGGAI